MKHQKYKKKAREIYDLLKKRKEGDVEHFELDEEWWASLVGYWKIFWYLN